MNTQTANTTDKNLQILNERTSLFNSRKGARVGDYLKMPYGLYTRFTHEWECHIQTGGGSGSFFLGEYISYSGSLDSGVKKADIQLTNETRKGQIWFFDKNISGANRGVYYEIDFRVFELKEGANTNGLPQIARYEKQQIINTAEKVTRINGNGNPYTLPLPEVIILVDYEMNDIFLSHIKKNTGLDFVKCTGGYKVQVLTHVQLTTLLLTHNFSCKYYCNSTYDNTLFLTFNRS